MNNNHSLESNRTPRRRGFSMQSLAMAAVLGISGMAGSAAIHAQSTAGSIFGNAPAGDTILVKSTTNGFRHEVKVDTKGRYTLNHVPAGVYTVVLEKDGNPAMKHLNVGVMIGRGSRVDFQCADGACEETASTR